MKPATLTVLVVDDDPDILEFLISTLTPCYTVLSATNGDDALRMASQELPAAILLDVMMPGGKDGFSTFADLQKNPRTRSIPVLLQTDINRKTGLAFDTDVLQRQLGKAPAAFLQKPLTSKKLLEEVAKVLPAART